MIFVYCETCGLRIPNEDVDSKKAVQVEDNRFLCAKCGSAKTAALAPSKIPAAEPVTASKPSGDSKRKITPVVGISTPDSKRRNTPAGGNAAVSLPGQPSARPTATLIPKRIPLIPVVGGAVALLVIGAIVFALRSDPETVAVKKPSAQTLPEPPRRENPPVLVEPVTTARTEPTEPSVAVAPVTPLANVAPPSEAPEKFTEELEKMRNDRAQGLLNEALAYASQKPDDVKGLRKKLDAVLRSYRSTPAGEEAFKKKSELQADTPPPPLDEAAFANALNAFDYVDLKEDKFSGDWSWENNTLKIGPGRFAIPYDPGGDYDVRVGFTALKQNGSPYGIYLRPDGGKQFVVALGLGQDDHAGISRIGGKSAMENICFTHLKAPLGTNTRHTLVAQMRKNLVRLYLDGQFVTQYEGDFADVSAGNERALKNTKVLGIFSDHAPIIFHTFEIAEISGKGKFIRAAVAKSESAPSETAAAKPVETAKVTDPSAALKSPASAYETLVWQAFTLAAKDGSANAKSRLETAKKDKAFAANSDALAFDLQIVTALENLESAIHKGVEELTDKRTFKFERVDGKTTAVGKGFKLHVKGLKNGKIVLEERVGGASAESQLDLEALTFASRLELARIGAGTNPEAAATLAAGLFLATLTPGSTVTESTLNTQIETAARLKAPAEFLQHLKARQAALQRERESDKLFAESRDLFNAKKNDDAKAKLTEFIAAAAGTASGERALEEVRTMLTELKARELKPGLWYAYYSGSKTEIFQKLLLSRAESKLKLPSPLPKEIPKDYWGIRAGGILRVETEGSYVFQVTADDYAQFFVNDLKAGEIKNKKDATFSATLKVGNNALRFHFAEHTFNYALLVKWKVPGATDFTEIPENVLWYDPGKVSAYEQTP